MKNHPVERLHIFVYGTLRRGEVNDINKHCADLASPQPGRVRGFLFDLKTCPGIQLSETGPEVVGEIYEIPPSLIPILDEIELGCGDFRRRRAEVVAGDGRALNCIVYEAGPAEVKGAELIRCGDWVSHRCGPGHSGVAQWMPANFRIVPLGDSAMVVEFGTSIDERVNEKVIALSEYVRAQAWPHVLDVVPSYCAVVLHFDARALVDTAEASVASLQQQLFRAASRLTADVAPAVDGSLEFRLPVCYEEAYAPDMLEISLATRLSPREIIARHSSRSYRIHMLGFSPGFPYLGGLDESLHVPRRSVPRSEVPEGSVAIGGAQTGVYPTATPGGWNLIGRTPIKLFDPHRQPTCLLKAGDRIRFVPISAEEFRRLAG
jgi:inhibitor of KinA